MIFLITGSNGQDGKLMKYMLKSLTHQVISITSNPLNERYIHQSASDAYTPANIESIIKRYL